MFAPNEACLNAAYEYDPDLLEHAMNQRVLITTPVTLLALLRTVAYNKAIGSFDVRVMPAVRKLEEMGLGNSELLLPQAIVMQARVSIKERSSEQNESLVNS